MSKITESQVKVVDKEIEMRKCDMCQIVMHIPDANTWTKQPSVTLKVQDRHRDYIQSIVKASRPLDNFFVYDANVEVKMKTHGQIDLCDICEEVLFTNE